MNKKENHQQSITSIRIREINKIDSKKHTPNKQNKIIRKYNSNKIINEKNNSTLQSNKINENNLNTYENNKNCITKRISQSSSNRLFQNGNLLNKNIQNSNISLIDKKNSNSKIKKNNHLFKGKENINNSSIRNTNYNYSYNKNQNTKNVETNKTINLNLNTIKSLNKKDQSPDKNKSINDGYKGLVTVNSEKENKRNSFSKYSYSSKSHSFNNIRNNNSSSQRRLSKNKNRNKNYKEPYIYNNYSLSITKNNNYNNHSSNNIKELSKLKKNNLNTMLIGNNNFNTRDPFNSTLNRKSYINISTLSTINTSKISHNKNLFLNNSNDNFNLKSFHNYTSQTKLLTTQNQNAKQKLAIKVNRKPQKVIKAILHTKEYKNQYLNNNQLKKKVFSNQMSKKTLYQNNNNNNINIMNPKYILYKYHKVLTKEEIKELQNNSKKIYFLGLIPERLSKKEYSYINLNKSFSYFQDHRILLNNSDNSIYLYRDISMKKMINKYSFYTNQKNDDSEGDYKIIKGDHLDYRYEIKNILGNGSYGEAIKCFDHKTNENVCIKIIKSNDKFQSQAMIEIKILEHIKEHDINNEYNIVKYYSYFKFRKHICIVFELLDSNLYEYIKNNNFQGFDIKQIKQFTTEILFCLTFLKSQKILHCDLKPENILLYKNNKNVKVIDFGSSCYEKEKMYSYIQSRFYRAPEVILEQGYNYEIDIWSLGCILCELFTGFPIFPGEDERDQLNYIMEYLDIPPMDIINISRKKNLFFDKNYFPFQISNSKGKIRKPNTKSFKEFLSGSNENFIDFIKKCLKWDPKNRLTPEEGLLHPFIISGMNKDKLNNHKNKIKQIKLMNIEKNQKNLKGKKNNFNSNSNLCLNLKILNTKENNNIKRSSESCCNSYRKNINNNFKMCKDISDNIYHICNSSNNQMNKNTISASISLKKMKKKKINNMKQLYTKKKIISYLELSET